jgi:hypothetical protein
MQGICTYIPGTNNVPREYTVAAILLLMFMVPISLVSASALLCFYVSTFRSMCVLLLLLLLLCIKPRRSAWLTRGLLQKAFLYHIDSPQLVLKH